MKIVTVLGHKFPMPDFLMDNAKKEWGSSDDPKGSIRLDLARAIIFMGILRGIIKAVAKEIVLKLKDEKFDNKDKRELDDLILKTNIYSEDALKLVETVENLHGKFFDTDNKKDCLAKIKELLTNCENKYNSIIENIAIYDNAQEHAENFSKILTEVIKRVEAIDPKSLMQTLFKKDAMRNAHEDIMKKICSNYSSLPSKGELIFDLELQLLEKIDSLIKKAAELKIPQQPVAIVTQSAVQNVGMLPPTSSVDAHMPPPPPPSSSYKPSPTKGGINYGVTQDILTNTTLRKYTIFKEVEKGATINEKVTTPSSTVNAIKTRQSVDKSDGMQQVYDDLDAIISIPVPSVKPS